jgi:TPR repeat protein
MVSRRRRPRLPSLDVLHRHGRDYSDAAKWVQPAAAHSYARAQVDLGYLYEQGKGVPLDYVSAYAWYKLAAAAGHSRGSERMKNLSRLMTQKQISEASNRAAQFPASQFPREGVSNSKPM